MKDEAGPFYFVDSFWGDEFREHVLRLSVATLLAPGNLPSLTNKRDSKFLFCTTHDDWAAIQDDPTFELLASQIEPIFVELCRKVPEFLKPIIAEQRRRNGLSVPQSAEEWDHVTITPDDVLAPEAYADLERTGEQIGIDLTVHHHYALRIFFMNEGHKAAACRAFEDGANVVFLGADLIMSDGTIREMERIVRQGRHVILTATLRFAQDECLEVLKARGMLELGKPLVIKPRDMVATLFPHLHPETACFEFDSPHFCDVATSASWRVPGDSGILLQNLNFYPILVNFDGIERHGADYFDEGGTIDGRYISNHFDPSTDIEVIDDSDRFMLASFTRRSEYYYPVTRTLGKSLPFLRIPYKIHLIRKTLNSPMGDPVKRHFYGLALRFHDKPLTPAWEEIECRAGEIVTRALLPLGLTDRLFAAYQAVGDWGRSLRFTRQGMCEEFAAWKPRTLALARVVFHFLMAALAGYQGERLRALVRRLR